MVCNYVNLYKKCEFFKTVYLFYNDFYIYFIKTYSIVHRSYKCKFQSYINKAISFIKKGFMYYKSIGKNIKFLIILLFKYYLSSNRNFITLKQQAIKINTLQIVSINYVYHYSEVYAFAISQHNVQRPS